MEHNIKNIFLYATGNLIIKSIFFYCNTLSSTDLFDFQIEIFIPKKIKS